jgi:hypothetical protein
MMPPKVGEPGSQGGPGSWFEKMMSAGAALPLIGDGADHGTEYLARSRR